MEVVERKGRGHPDTLADRLAERLSSRYCQYTLEKFGVILNHNFDKVGLLGGESTVEFGRGRMRQPIRVLLNGRATETFGDQRIALWPLLTRWAREFLAKELPVLDADRYVDFQYNISTANTPGYPVDDFAPTGASDLRQLRELRSSDTAVVCAQFPPTMVESAVLAIEDTLTNDTRREQWPWLGSDIKVLACRTGQRVQLTACIPQIAEFVPDLDTYRANLKQVREVVELTVAEHFAGHDVEVVLNTKDDDAGSSLYLTAIGSCLESGDEGLVGRGNRPSGVISALRAHSGEAACGKNPAFFPGKVYTAAAAEIAQRLYHLAGTAVEVWLAAQEGRPLHDPWQVIVIHDGPPPPTAVVEHTLTEVLSHLPDLTQAMINEQTRLC